MYKHYWGLKELPFENVPDPRFFYTFPQHEEALGRLIYTVKTGKGMAMLTAEIGSGKTLISRVLVLKFMPESECKIVLITHPALSAIELLKEILYQLGVNTPQGAKVDLLHSLNAEMVKNMEDGKRMVIIIDEAHAIDDMDVFEELRLLLNFQLNERFLLTLILLGQPNLTEKISKIPALEQRIFIKYVLSALSLPQTEEYIAFRLHTAGSQSNVFTKEAVKIIHEYSRGLPRKINNICDLSLLAGFNRKLKHIDSDVIIGLVDEIR